MPPPPPPPPPPAMQQGPFSIKTPQPDISIGLRDNIVVKALQQAELTELEAIFFLRAMQGNLAPDGSGPMLRSVPTQRPLRIRFPFLVVEGKSYATGAPIFEAQNQAAVAGACALNILHRLDVLAGKADAEADAEAAAETAAETETEAGAVVFSVCSQGPYHELWVHHVSMEEGVRTYEMVILKTCNAALPEELLPFLFALDRVMAWAGDVFLGRVTRQLRKVVRALRV